MKDELSSAAIRFKSERLAVEAEELRESLSRTLGNFAANKEVSLSDVNDMDNVAGILEAAAGTLRDIVTDIDHADLSEYLEESEVLDEEEIAMMIARYIKHTLGYGTGFTISMVEDHLSANAVSLPYNPKQRRVFLRTMIDDARSYIGETGDKIVVLNNVKLPGNKGSFTVFQIPNVLVTRSNRMIRSELAEGALKPNSVAEITTEEELDVTELERTEKVIFDFIQNSENQTVQRRDLKKHLARIIQDEQIVGDALQNLILQKRLYKHKVSGAIRYSLHTATPNTQPAANQLEDEPTEVFSLADIEVGRAILNSFLRPGIHAHHKMTPDEVLQFVDISLISDDIDPARYIRILSRKLAGRGLLEVGQFASQKGARRGSSRKVFKIGLADPRLKQVLRDEVEAEKLMNSLKSQDV